MLSRLDNGKLVVVAGHYCISPELEELSCDGAAERLSFLEGVKAYSAALRNGVSADLCLWINDIGATAEERRVFRDFGERWLPENYANIASDYNTTPEDIYVELESVTRNRASKELKRSLKSSPDLFQLTSSDDPSLVRCINTPFCEATRNHTKKVYSIEGPDNESLVVKEGSNPKCNLILATLFRRLAEAEGPGPATIACFFNEIYLNRIRLGIHVYTRLFARDNVDFLTYFCNEQECYPLNLGDSK